MRQNKETVSPMSNWKKYVTVQIGCYILAAVTPDERRGPGLRLRLQNGKSP